MNLLLKWLLTLFENPEIIKYVVLGVAVICVLGLAYRIFRSLKMLLGIGMVILILLLVFARCNRRDPLWSEMAINGINSESTLKEGSHSLDKTNATK